MREVVRGCSPIHPSKQNQRAAEPSSNRDCRARCAAICSMMWLLLCLLHSSFPLPFYPLDHFRPHSSVASIFSASFSPLFGRLDWIVRAAPLRSSSLFVVNLPLPPSLPPCTMQFFRPLQMGPSTREPTNFSVVRSNIKQRFVFILM